MTAIVLAGDRTKADSLINHSKVGCKAMIDIDGLPMVRRVLNALRASKVVEKITLAGPEAAALGVDGPLSRWIASGEVVWREPASSPSTSAYEAMQSLDRAEAVLLTTADHPLLTAEIVDAFGRQSMAANVDVAVGLAPHALVTEAYPGIRKTVLRFSDGDFCGCNLFAFLTPEGRRAARFWRRIEQERKKPLMVIGLLGWTAVLRYRLGLL
ncbi:MAG: nucleotidyltransferase family protein, partial [Halioglobus sp.]|nr:nucleotidyltransferase family protein [Halioglobus sp.]